MKFIRLAPIILPTLLFRIQFKIVLESNFKLERLDPSRMLPRYTMTRKIVKLHLKIQFLHLVLRFFLIQEISMLF